MTRKNPASMVSQVMDWSTREHGNRLVTSPMANH